MITDALLSFVAWLAETILGWLPVIEPPDWLGNASGLAQVMAVVGSFDPWIPVNLALTILAAVLLCIVTGFAIKLGRSVASYFLAGGGSSG